ncbi:MAG: sugar ABC transporter permease [Planctomycetota bacterium]
MRAARRKQLGIGLLWISPWIIGFSVFLLLPMAMSFYYSFTDYPLLGVPVFVGADNYARLVQDEVFWVSIKNTALFTIVLVPLMTTASVLTAVLLNSAIAWRTVHRAAIFLPQLVPLVATCMIWQWLFNPGSGLINRALGWVGIEGPSWLQDTTWAMPGIGIMTLWVIGQPVVIYLAALQDVPRSLYEAADLDGVGPIGRFFNVTLPMISPVVLFNVIMTLLGMLQIFVQPYIMTGGGPGEATLFYAQYLYQQAFEFRDMGYACAMAWVQVVIIVGLTGLIFLAARRLVHYQGS